MSRYGYLEVFNRVLGIRDNEITYPSSPHLVPFITPTKGNKNRTGLLSETSTVMPVIPVSRVNSIGHGTGLKEDTMYMILSAVDLTNTLYHFIPSIIC